MKYIQLKSKEHFREVMKEYNKDWKDFLWNHFRGNTCYVVDEDYFINLEKAQKLWD